MVGNWFADKPKVNIEHNKTENAIEPPRRRERQDQGGEIGFLLPQDKAMWLSTTRQADRSQTCPYKWLQKSCM